MGKELSPDVEQVSERVLECGLTYVYCPQSKKLSLLDKNKSILMWIQCKDFLHNYIDDYIQIFDKAVQIQTLRISAYTSNKIFDVMDRGRLPPLLHGTAHLSRHVLSLDKKRFEEFSSAVQAEYNLKNFFIKFNKGSRITASHEYEGHYTARLKVIGHHGLTVRSTYLHQLLLYLADCINLDAAAGLYAIGRRDQATALMNLASQALIMSNLLDPYYKPLEQIHPTSQIVGSIL